ncbi:hypothetical protein XavaCFBP5823_09030 [Xanthomonas axonopodis pv. vasculorum]|nr:hypothetical protein XavaCFBP5823_09030 [Xanthomonas axonopodis pv. vasculorum]
MTRPATSRYVRTHPHSLPTDELVGGDCVIFRNHPQPPALRCMCSSQASIHGRHVTWLNTPQHSPDR